MKQGKTNKNFIWYSVSLSIKFEDSKCLNGKYHLWNNKHKTSLDEKPIYISHGETSWEHKLNFKYRDRDSNLMGYRVLRKK